MEDMRARQWCLSMENIGQSSNSNEREYRKPMPVFELEGYEAEVEEIQPVALV
jgi:hypothetical protein